MELYDIVGANAQVKYEDDVSLCEKHRHIEIDENLPKRIYAKNTLKIKEKIQNSKVELIALSICLLTFVFFMLLPLPICICSPDILAFVLVPMSFAYAFGIGGLVIYSMQI